MRPADNQEYSVFSAPIILCPTKQVFNSALITFAALKTDALCQEK